jgi:hypothetical protein
VKFADLGIAEDRERMCEIILLDPRFTFQFDGTTIIRCLPDDNPIDEVDALVSQELRYQVWVAQKFRGEKILRETPEIIELTAVQQSPVDPLSSTDNR